MIASDRGPIGVVGMSHLGSVIAAAWLRLGRYVRAIDADGDVVRRLRRGLPPIFEPGLSEAFIDGTRTGRFWVGETPSAVEGCELIFVARDTPVDDLDRPDVTAILRDVDEFVPFLRPGSLVVISAQLPVGTTGRIRARLRGARDDIEVLYVPENLRLGQALADYLQPGHIVIGAEDSAASERVRALFAPMNPTVLVTNLATAEMTKHALNAYLATSITFANQVADVCAAVGADYTIVKSALRLDSRVGKRAYLDAGFGFAGGTLGRDLRVLEAVDGQFAQPAAPIFTQVLDYNAARLATIGERLADAAGTGGRLCILGMTYKAGTSTLRRSPGVAIAATAMNRGSRVSAHDPVADLTPLREDGIYIGQTPYDAARGADVIVILTDWPEYQQLDPLRLGHVARRRRLLDPKAHMRGCEPSFFAAGWEVVFSNWPPASWFQ